MRKTLNALSIDKLPEGQHADTLVPNLTLWVGKSRKRWMVRYRQGGRQHGTPLGYYPAVGVAEAREKAREVLGRLDAGMPVAVASTPHPTSPKVMTLGRLIDQYEAMRRKEGHRIKSLDEAMRTVRRGLKDWLDVPARQFSKNDLRAARDAMSEGRSHMGNRLLGYASPILRWAASEDHVDFNFASAIRRAAETKRDRVLSLDELKAVWKATYELGDSDPAKNFGRAVRLLIVTGQRKSEVFNLRYGSVLDGVWRQKAADNKPGREHRLRLPELALTQIGTGTARALVFHGEAEDGVIGAISKLKTKLDEKSGISGWRLHDLRRSVATEMQEAGVPNHIVQSVLNHAVAGVGAAYLHAQMDKQKAEALAVWAGVLESNVSGRRSA